MLRQSKLLALVAGLVISHAHAQSQLTEEVLISKLQAGIEQRFDELAQIFGPARAQKLASVDGYQADPPRNYSQIEDYMLPIADPSFPVYGIVVQYTAVNHLGQTQRMGRKFKCYVTIQRDWNCYGFGSEWEIQ
jgi:hypothetical protein